MPVEKIGFDCSKGHPAMGNYHYHQNPSTFNLGLNVISTVCNLYAADGLYSIDSTPHSPLLGFAYDGFPVYGAYGYKNADGTVGVVCMKSSYSLRDITTRTTYADGTRVTPGPPVNATYGLNQIPVENGVWALFTGDINQDEAIDALDYLQLDPDVMLGNLGYLITELNGDAVVEAYDCILLDTNIVNGIESIEP